MGNFLFFLGGGGGQKRFVDEVSFYIFISNNILFAILLTFENPPITHPRHAMSSWQMTRKKLTATKKKRKCIKTKHVHGCD